MGMREQKAKDYLSTIHILSAYGPVRGAYVAREMKLSRPTVSVALRKLEEEGYITVDQDHLIRLTGAGKQLARESLQEKTRDEDAGGRNGRGSADGGEPERSGPTPEQAICRLEKEHAAAIPEAVLILSKRYYAVRTVDVARFLGQSSATVRAKLRRMEDSGYVLLGEEGTVRLTEFGSRIAEQLYARRAPRRDQLMKNGIPIMEAERDDLSEGL